LKFHEILRELFIGAGVDWVLWLLVALSVWSVALIVERYVFYLRRKVPDDLLTELSHGRFDGVPADSMERAVAERAGELAKRGLGRDDLQARVEVELRKERQRYERGLTFLATLGNNAPFVGLLGTVVGIMAAFYQLSDIKETTARNEFIMGSISEALVATAMGILVAIPAVLFYNVFRKRVGTASEQAREVATHRLLHVAPATSPADGGSEGDDGRPSV
jgi:biopolymer transport protein ExbB